MLFLKGDNNSKQISFENFPPPLPSPCLFQPSPFLPNLLLLGTQEYHQWFCEYRFTCMWVQKQTLEVFLNISQNSLENTFAGASFLVKLKVKETFPVIFSSELCGIFKNTFL